MKEEKNNIEEILIARYLSEEITPDEQNRLIRWIEADKENRRYFNQMKSLWQAANPVFNPQEINTEEAYTQVAGKLHINKKQRTPYIIWFNRVAAVLFLPLLIATIYTLLVLPSKTDATYQTIYAPYGTFSETILPDGSKVSLNAGSSLRYPTSFGNRRNVYLDGEGYFEVISSPEKPFIVHTGNLTVKATGTKFHVEDYSKDTLAAVTMIEGIVSATVDAQVYALKPNDRILYSKASNLLQQFQTTPYKWYAWKDGSMVFRDDPLKYVFKRLSQTFNVEIIIKDLQLADHPYRATFTNESLEEIMRLLKISAPIYFKEIERNTADNDYQNRRVIEVYSSMN